jgi:hypothetical protein
MLTSGECLCVLSQSDLATQYTTTDCSSSGAYSAYNVSNLRISSPAATTTTGSSSSSKLNITVTPVLRKTPIEVGDTVALYINNSLSDNILTYVNFSATTPEKSAIGNAALFTEYTTPGVHTVSIRVTSISDPSQVLERTMTLTVIAVVDKHPMHSLSLSYAKTSDKSVELSVVTAGGAPYTCSANSGDSADTTALLKSATRVNKFKLVYTYSMFGLYNATVTCSSGSVNSTVSQSTLVYLPNKAASNFTQLFLNKTGLNSDSVIPLSLPFGKLGRNVKYQVVDISEMGTSNGPASGN